MKKTPHNLSRLKQVPRVWLGVTILGFMLCILSYPVLAQEAGVFIVPPQGNVMAGQMTRFILFFHNPEKKAMTTDAYNRVMVTIKKDNKKIVVEATPLDADPDALVTIPGNGYEKREYKFLLPQSMDGNISISLPEFAAGPVWFVAREIPMKDRTEQLALNEKEAIIHPLAKYLSPYEPMYFLVGVDPGPEKSKFQISFKYKIFNAKKNGGWKSFLDGIHLAYTQTSFWDLSSDSAAFEDTSYKPELFYFIPKIDLGIPFIKAFGIQTGYRHESNGKEGVDSRSTNFLYIEPIMAFSLGNNYFLKIAPRVWTYINNIDSTNADLDQYRGYFKFQLSAGNLDGFILDTNTHWADKGPSFQVDLSYPLKVFKKEVGFYLHLQYFNGYAETLFHYKEKDESIRLGLSIVR